MPLFVPATDRITPEAYLNAAKNGDMNTVEQYLDQNTGNSDALNVVDTNKNTALLLSILNCHPGIAKLLFAIKAIAATIQIDNYNAVRHMAKALDDTSRSNALALIATLKLIASLKLTAAGAKPIPSKKYNPIDCLGTPVAAHFETKDVRHKAATAIQTNWRQHHRATHLHRTPTLFNPKSKNSRQNKHRIYYMPQAFHHLCNANVPALFTTSTHSSTNLSNILHDGIIYPGHLSQIQGSGTSTDTKQHDKRLVFTSPFSNTVTVNSFRNDPFITLNTLALLKHNNASAIYFKFIDWAHNTPYSSSLASVTLCDDVSLRLYVQFPIHQFTFYSNTTGSILASITIPPEECVYHGLNGLHEYLTFFIFRIIYALSAAQQNLKDKLYAHFAKLDKKNELITHLQLIAKYLINASELDFVQPLKLSIHAIDLIMMNNHLFDLAKLKKHICNNKLMGVRKFLYQYDFDSHIKNSYMLASGLLALTQAAAAPDIEYLICSRYNSILTGAPLAAARFKALQSIPSELIHHVNKQFLSTQYRHEQGAVQEPYEIQEGKIVYRPNHGLIHALRVASYVPHVLAALQLHEQPEFKAKYAKLNALQLQKCLMFAVTGRENDNGFYDNEAEYYVFRQLAGKNFTDYYQGKSDFTATELEEYKTALIAMGDPENHDPIHVVMNICHKIDLSRCYSTQNMETRQIPYLENYLPSKEAAALLIHYGCQCIAETGDRLCYAPANFPDSSRPRMTSHFIDLSFHPAKCLGAIASVSPPDFTPKPNVSASTITTLPSRQMI